MAYNTIQHDDYINAKKKAIMKNIEVLNDGLSRFEQVLYKVTGSGITNGKTNRALYAYVDQLHFIHSIISEDYEKIVKMQAEHFVDKIEQAGKYLYD